MNLPYFLVPALVGLICGIIGYILGKMNSKNDDPLASTLQAELDASKAHVKNLTTRILALEAELTYKEISNTIESPVAEEPILPFDGSLASHSLSKEVIENDLKIVEGIGPKVEKLLHDAEIRTWRDLSETSTEKLQEILETGGENYAIHNPITWSKQALYAYEGKWQELNELQESLRAAKE